MSGGKVLRGGKAIAAYLDVSVRTVERWARLKDAPLPVYRFGGRLEAHVSALDAWREYTRRHVMSYSVAS